MARRSTFAIIPSAQITDDDTLIGIQGGTATAGSATQQFLLSDLRTYFQASTTNPGINTIVVQRGSSDNVTESADGTTATITLQNLPDGRYLTGTVTEGTEALLLVENTVYAVTGVRPLTLPLNPAIGTNLRISNLSGSVITISTNGQRLMNTANTQLILDDVTASFELVFINPTVGWVVIGANSN
ncbi:MAG: hypothetical protein MPL62_18240 [Alphaproteobacteria bacterium]|nr:hypothetical protein [Alphaproteobacteria bacterium]